MRRCVRPNRLSERTLVKDEWVEWSWKRLPFALVIVRAKLLKSLYKPPASSQALSRISKRCALAKLPFRVKYVQELNETNAKLSSISIVENNHIKTVQLFSFYLQSQNDSHPMTISNVHPKLYCRFDIWIHLFVRNVI